MNAFYRDIIVRLVKKTLKGFLANVSFGEVPIKLIQVVTAIEDYIRFRQAQQIAGIQDLRIVSALDQYNFLTNPIETSFDIRKFLQFCLIPAQKIKDTIKTRLHQQYGEDLDELGIQLKIVDEAFDMIKRLDEIHGIKGILPCVFNGLNRTQ
jgi:hypothetical protein